MDDRIRCVDESLVRLSSSLESVLLSLTVGSKSSTTSAFQQQQQQHQKPNDDDDHHITTTTQPQRPTGSSTTVTTTTTTTTTTDIDSNSVVTKYAPITLEKQFLDVYRLFRPALIPVLQTTHNSTTNTNTNASAFIQGARGSGKSLLVRQVLRAIHDEIDDREAAMALSSSSSLNNNNNKKVHFRCVYINGLLTPGHSVHTVVQEILYQLIHHQNHHHYYYGSNTINEDQNPVKTTTTTTTTTVSDTTTTASNTTTKMNHLHTQPRRKRQRRTAALDSILENDAHSTTTMTDLNATTAAAANNNTNEQPHHSHAPPPPPPLPPDDDVDDLLQQLQWQSQQKQTFTNQLQLLNEIIEVASMVDQIPILFILDELDTFLSTTSSSSNSSTGTGSTNSANNNTSNRDSQNNTTNNSNFVFHTERQLLMYHLLERTTTPNSCCNFIGISSDSTIMMKLEKRIKSRAEGISKFIMTPSTQCNSYELHVVPVLCHCIVDDNNNNNTATVSINSSSNTINNTSMIVPSLKLEFTNMLLPVAEDDENDDGTKTSSSRRIQQYIYETLQRNYNLGKDIRWFTRVFYIALSLYRTDLLLAQLERNSSESNNTNGECTDEQQQQQQQGCDSIVLPTTSSSSQIPKFHIKYVREAMIDMGASFGSDIHSATVVDRTMNNNNNDDHNNNTSNVPETDIRIHTLRDLSGPQLTLVLSARRILYRDSCVAQRSGGSNNNNNSKNNTKSTYSNEMSSTAEYNTQQLTFRRMINEYQTSYKGQTSKYAIRILQLSFFELLHIGVFRPSIDHSGTIPFQYQFRDAFIYHHNNMDVMERLPLHMTLDIHYEIKHAIDHNLLLNCSTALREWGRKIN